MAKPGALILTGYGINCDEETRYAFELAGAEARIVHVNDIIERPRILDEYLIFAFPGGFSYGDDTGSGRALANRIRNNLIEEFGSFLERDTLMLGICNGFQVMANLGIVPALNGTLGQAGMALEYNRSFRYECRWVDLSVDAGSPSVFTKGLTALHIPVAHGEGNFYAPPETLSRIEEKRLAPLRYAKPDGSSAGGEFPYNPNGSQNDIAAVCDASGRRMGMMPHPERAIFFTQREDWTFVKERIRRSGGEVPIMADGTALFENAVRYFR
jgi:phosphoribosylformylglycinamidine synthase subunit PurQ / glutaminase